MPLECFQELSHVITGFKLDTAKGREVGGKAIGNSFSSPSSFRIRLNDLAKLSNDVLLWRVFREASHDNNHPFCRRYPIQGSQYRTSSTPRTSIGRNRRCRGGRIFPIKNLRSVPDIFQTLLRCCHSTVQGIHFSLYIYHPVTHLGQLAVRGVDSRSQCVKAWSQRTVDGL